MLVRPGEALPVCDLVILPGSKSTIADLAALRAAGWDGDLVAHRRRGGRILGVCGGYQMLGASVADPAGVEGPPGVVPGLGLLPVATVLGGDKQLVAVRGRDAEGVSFRGYEMHVGRTEGAGAPLLRMDDGRGDGAVSADGLVMGCYVHGLFADDAQRGAWLRRLGAEPGGLDYEAGVDAVLDGWAAHLAAHVDLERLLDLAR